MRLPLTYLPLLLLCLTALVRVEAPAATGADDKKTDDKTVAPKDVEAPAKTRNWSSWRGPEQTGVSREKDLPATFSIAKKLNVVFTSPHGSLATPIVQNDTVYLVGKS